MVVPKQRQARSAQAQPHDPLSVGNHAHHAAEEGVHLSRVQLDEIETIKAQQAIPGCGKEISIRRLCDRIYPAKEPLIHSPFFEDVLGHRAMGIDGIGGVSENQNG